MTKQMKNILGFIFIAILLLAVAIVGAMLVFHPSSDVSSTYIGVMLMVAAVGFQVLLMLRGPNR